MTPLVVATTLLAGVIGALLRFGVSRLFAPVPDRLPWGVLIVNVVGSLVGGVVIGLLELGAIGDDVKLVVLTGFAGGLTTFSTFSVETIQLTQVGRWRAAVLSVSANLLLGVGAAVLGCCLAVWLG